MEDHQHHEHGDFDICNSTYLVGALLIISLAYNCIITYADNKDDSHLELEMKPDQLIPDKNAQTQTLPIENEDEMFTEQMRNYMKRQPQRDVDIKVEIDPKRRKYSV